MSRIGKLPIKVPSNIKVAINNDIVTFVADKITRTYQIMPDVQIAYNDGVIKLSAKEGRDNASVDVGMDRSNINNIILGLQHAFKVTLEINGVGYKAAVDKGVILLTLGYSHEIFYPLPASVTAHFEKPNLIILSSYDKILVGQVAAEIISFRKPEPYKGKGVKILGKPILRKEGKKK